MRRAGKFFRRGRRRGFTLAEFVVAAGIVFLVFAAAMDISWRAWAVAAESRKDAAAANALRAAVAWVSHDLYRASGVAAAGPGRLAVVMPGGGTVTYALADGGLTRSDESAARVVAAGITWADFSVAAVTGGSLATAEFTAAGGGKVRTCVYVLSGGG
jgi:Tfp pilus assembly protein PilW